MRGADPETIAQVLLFNPREQDWEGHFRWREDATLILGRTACGRATITALQLNNDHLVRARRRWVMAGWHPPEDWEPGLLKWQSG